MRTKISILLDFMANEDWRSALRLAVSFARLGEEKQAITRAWQAIQSPAFYREIGKDPDALIAEGIAALRRRYIRIDVAA